MIRTIQVLATCAFLSACRYDFPLTGTEFDPEIGPPSATYFYEAWLTDNGDTKICDVTVLIGESPKYTWLCSILGPDGTSETTFYPSRFTNINGLDFGLFQLAYLDRPDGSSDKGDYGEYLVAQWERQGDDFVLKLPRESALRGEAITDGVTLTRVFSSRMRDDSFYGGIITLRRVTEPDLVDQRSREYLEVINRIGFETLADISMDISANSFPGLRPSTDASREVSALASAFIEGEIESLNTEIEDIETQLENTRNERQDLENQRQLAEENRRLREQLAGQQQAEIRRQQAIERQRVCGAWTCVQLEDGTVLLQTQDGSAWVYRHGELAPRNIWPRAQ